MRFVKFMKEFEVFLRFKFNNVRILIIIKCNRFKLQIIKKNMDFHYKVGYFFNSIFRIITLSVNFGYHLKFHIYKILFEFF